MNTEGVHLIGVIADTHGLVRPACRRALSGVERIFHAGDVGGPDVLAALAEIAPVEAVAGNVDVSRDLALPDRLDIEVGGLQVHVSHGHEVGSPTPARLVQRYGADVILFGHTHKAAVERIGRQLVVNPGAAGPARFLLVPSVARLTIRGGEAEVELVPLL